MEFMYSRCARTIDLYNNIKLDSSMYIKFLLIIPRILYALFIFEPYDL